MFLSLMRWGDKYLQNGRSPLSFVEAGTGRAVEVRVPPSSDIEIRLS